MSTWSDRRGQFQKGKEVVPPPTEGRAFGSGVLESVRRASIDSANGLEKSISNLSSKEPSSPTGQRRRSSNTGLFANLQQHKRGSEDYGDRRMSHGEHADKGGMFSGWYNSTFRGYQKPQGQQQPKQMEMPKGMQQQDPPHSDFTD